MPSLWRIDPATLPTPSARTRKLQRGPLFDLAALQQAIVDGALGGESVWLATTKAEHNLQDLTWAMRDLLDCIKCLSPTDFKGSEWCEDSHGNRYACDAYAIGYDDTARRRARNSCNYYLKFSLTDDGVLTLVLISCHLS